MLWCSASAWASATAKYGGHMDAFGISGEPIGVFDLKGVSESMELVHCMMHRGGEAATMITTKYVRRASVMAAQRISLEAGVGSSGAVADPAAVQLHACNSG
eukprot:358378-Chlamydomonas_euryale.AAC.2